MSPRGRRILWALVAGGVLIRIVPAWASVGIAYDIEALQLVADRMQEPHPWALYADLNGEVVRWAYPTGSFPLLVLADVLAVPGLLPFHGLVQVPGILADAAIALIVQSYLGQRGSSERVRLVAASIVALGPSFIVINGYEGQLDTVAILPAVAALLVWERLPVGRRALAAGALIGVGASIKTFPLIVVLALLPSVRGWREATVLVAAAVAVPLLLLAPFLLAEPGATKDALNYAGIPGIGGLSLLVQPELAKAWLVTERFPELSAMTHFLQDVRMVLLLVALGVVAVVLYRRRPDPPTSAVLLWLAVYVSAVNFGPRYVVWAIPFALMAGYMREAAVAQVIAAPAAFLIAARTWDAGWIPPLYVGLMLVLLASFATCLVVLMGRAGRRSSTPA